MSRNQFSIAVAMVAIASFVAGVAAGELFSSVFFAAGASFLIPSAFILVFYAPIGRAWWSANEGESRKPFFRSEANGSLWFVIAMTAGISVVAGTVALIENSFFEAAFAGLVLAMTVFGITRQRDLAARKL